MGVELIFLLSFSVYCLHRRHCIGPSELLLTKRDAPLLLRRVGINSDGLKTIAQSAIRLEFSLVLGLRTPDPHQTCHHMSDMHRRRYFQRPTNPVRLGMQCV
ncbi:hypothetical protein B0H21DRAFT_250290 [Amylocystis lapponica]|nr:hypothetical protein B0H21DRAFT_250290 [Amylocystis lapponica]